MGNVNELEIGIGVRILLGNTINKLLKKIPVTTRLIQKLLIVKTAIIL